MNLFKKLLVGTLLIVTNLALAATIKTSPPSPETILTPGARLVVGDSPDEDFTILAAGEEAQTKPAAPLPQKITPGTAATATSTIKPAPGSEVTPVSPTSSSASPAVPAQVTPANLPPVAPTSLNKYARKTIVTAATVHYVYKKKVAVAKFHAATPAKLAAAPQAVKKKIVATASAQHIYHKKVMATALNHKKVHPAKMAAAHHVATPPAIANNTNKKAKPVKVAVNKPHAKSVVTAANHTAKAKNAAETVTSTVAKSVAVKKTHVSVKVAKLNKANTKTRLAARKPASAIGLASTAPQADAVQSQ